MRILIKALPSFYIALFAACFIMANSSCTRDKCSSVKCINGGSCDNGICSCPTGYQGTDCQTLSRAPFLGTWSFSGQSNITSAAYYPVSIEAGSPNINDITLTNFLNYFSSPVNAFVENDSLYIQSQLLQGNYVQGTGLITYTPAGNTIVISGTITNATTQSITTYTTSATN